MARIERGINPRRNPRHPRLNMINQRASKVSETVSRGARECACDLNQWVVRASRALALAALQRDTGKTLPLCRNRLATWSRGSVTCASGIARCRDKKLPGRDSRPAGLRDRSLRWCVSPHPQTLEKRALALWLLQQLAELRSY